MPDSSPILAWQVVGVGQIGALGAVKAAALMRLYGSSEPVFGLTPGTTPMRAPSVVDPVMFWLLTPLIANPGVKGEPVWKVVRPDTCQPLSNAFVNALSPLSGRL